MRRSFSHVIDVRPDDLDELQHVNNAVYLTYVENVARAHADSVGLSLDVLLRLGVVPVVRRHVVTYHRPAFLGDRLVVSTLVVSSRGMRATRHNEIRREHDGVLLVDTDTDWVWINPETGVPRPVPDDIREAFGFPADRKRRDRSS